MIILQTHTVTLIVYCAVSTTTLQAQLIYALYGFQLFFAVTPGEARFPQQAC